MTRKKLKPQRPFVIDAGNGNVKVSFAGETEVIPSLLSLNDGNYIRGGFTLANESWILGWDNCNRIDATSVADSNTGKLDLLPLLIAGSVSAMRHCVEPKDRLAFHVLTLNNDKRQLISDAIQQATQELAIDGQFLELDVELSAVYPEGFGASLYAASVYPEHRRVAVLDMGNGTLNLSQYHQSSTSLPRRESFSFVPFGVSSLINYAKQLMASETTNGRVDVGLIRQALDSNSYLYLSDYQGTNIWDLALRAAKVWSNQSEVKSFLVQALRLVTSDIPVVLVGGGFAIHVMQQTVRDILTSQGKEANVHIAEQPLTIGVHGLGVHLSK